MTADYLRSIVDYDPDTGVFRWKVSRPKCAVGSVLGYRTVFGYIHCSIDRKNYYLHRLAWLYVFGQFPSKHIDHINGVRDDNRICNLREADKSQNGANKRVLRDGLKGCYFHKRDQTWMAMIRINGKKTGLGSFSTEQEAHEAYVEAAKRTFGEFARAA